MICMTTLFFSNRENFEKFVKKPSVKAIDNDLALQYCPI